MAGILWRNVTGCYKEHTLELKEKEPFVRGSASSNTKSEEEEDIRL